MVNLKFKFSYWKNFLEITKLSAPIIIGQIGSVAMGVTDTIMLGKVGKTELAAAGIANQIYVLFVVIGMGTLSATAPMIATSKGAKNKSECGEILRTGIELSFIISVFLCLILFLLGENFHIFRQPEQVTIMARNYIRIVTVSTIPMMLFIALKQFSDGLSATLPAMVITFVGVFANIFFNWVFIYGNLTFPAMGIEGSAIATLFSRIIMALLLVIYIFNSAKLKEYLPPLISTFNTWPVLIKIVRVGFPSGLQLFFEIGAYTGAGVFVGWLGTNELAANQIVMALSAITYMGASGFSVAGSIQVGLAFGESNQKGILTAGNVTIILTALFMLGCCFCFIFYKYPLIHIFSQDPHVTEVAATIIVIAGLYQLSDGLQAVGLGILRGIEDVNIPTVYTLIAYWVIALPTGYILGFTFDLGIKGIWIGLLIGLSFSAIMLNLRFFHLVLSGKTKQYVATRLEKV